MVIFLRRRVPLLLLFVFLATGCASVTTIDAGGGTGGDQRATENSGNSEEVVPDATMAESDLGAVLEGMEAEERMGDPEVTTESPEITIRDIPGAAPEVTRQIANSESFWANAGAAIGLTYVPLDTDRLFPRSVLESTDRVRCTFNGNPSFLDPDVARFNAFVAPCEEGVSVVWDDLELLPRIDARFPGAGVSTLIAHEWGHVAQFQIGVNNRSTLLNEQQADCYAGAFVGWAESRGLDPFTTPRARDLAIVSTLETRDRVGSDPSSASAHGNGFDRVRAVQEGYERGVTFCAGYSVNPPPITQMVFQDDTEVASQGNLPFDEALTILDPVVGDYFEGLAPEPLAEFFEQPDIPALEILHAAIGDGAVATSLGLQYAQALQVAVGEETNGIRAALQRTCLVGTFLNASLGGAVPVTLSPGDLDETIMTLVSSPSVIANPGLVFEMVAALRVGTTQGLSGCQVAR